MAHSWWAEAANTEEHVSNRVFLRPMKDKKAYETWNGRKPELNYCHVFGSKCHNLRDREYLGKFDAQSDEGIFLGYLMNSLAFRVYNKRTSVVMEYVNVTFQDVEHSKIDSKNSTIEDVDDPTDIVTLHYDEHIVKDGSVTIVAIDESDIKTTTKPMKSESRVLKNHPTHVIIGDIIEKRKTRGKKNVDYRAVVGRISMACYTSTIRPKIQRDNY